jgi:hypothetical protein
MEIDNAGIGMIRNGLGNSERNSDFRLVHMHATTRSRTNSSSMVGHRLEATVVQVECIDRGGYGTVFKVGALPPSSCERN